jgi:hypothetical protein
MRDGRVRADIVDVAPDLSGFLTDVTVRDNQRVHCGDIIFQTDRAVLQPDEVRSTHDGVIKFQHLQKISFILIRNTVVPTAIRTTLGSYFGD